MARGGPTIPGKGGSPPLVLAQLLSFLFFSVPTHRSQYESLDREHALKAKPQTFYDPQQATEGSPSSCRVTNHLWWDANPASAIGPDTCTPDVMRQGAIAYP